MATTVNRLSVAQIERLSKPGRHPDGNGLFLDISKNGDTSWLFRYRGGEPFEEGKSKGKRRHRYMGLGNYPLFSLAQARERAKQARQLWADGIDPIDKRKAEKLAEAERQAQVRAEAAKLTTFKQAAEGYIEDNRASWRNAVHAQQWENTLAADVYPVLGKLPVSAVETAHVVKVLRPIWNTKHVTATRVRGRIEAVLDWAKANGFRDGENAARWRGNLDAVLPATKKLPEVEVEHHEAMAFAEVPAFMAKLAATEGRTPAILRLAVLTCVRISELLGMRGEELDLASATWTIPKARTKNGEGLRVALSPPAVELLKSLRPQKHGLVFPGERLKTKPVKSEVVRLLLRSLVGEGPTLHGFRSSFSDWRAVVHPTRFSADLVEASLGHTRGSKVRRAYERDDLLEPRRPLMKAWADFCTGKAAVPSAKVRQLRPRRAA
jgi:integrase